jgi:uncharacterized protein
MKLRDAIVTDFPKILALNAESEHFLSPLSFARLELLHGEAAYHRVLEAEGQVGAFLLAFRETAKYDSPNFLWFTQHYTRFIYIDRVVVSALTQGRGIGRLLYSDLFSYARGAGIKLVTCEFDVEPPNEQSRRFHQTLGFQEVGSQSVGQSNKIVSLQACRVEL